MSLVATKREADLAKYAPGAKRQGGTHLLESLTTASGAVTIQIHSGRASQTTAFFALYHFVTPHNADQARLINSLVGRLNEVRHAFGMNIKQLASVMQVTRVTIYDWMRQDEIQKLRAPTIQRLVQMQALASMWGKLPALAGNYLAEPLPDGSGTLEDRLSSNSLPSPIHLQQINQQLLSVLDEEKRLQAHRARQAHAIAEGTAKILSNPQAYGLEAD